MVALRGIAWDHRRCWGPLEPSTAPYRALTGVQATWDRRSLYSFGEGDLAAFCRDYDLVIYDHPFVGEAATRGWLRDLSPYLSADDLSAFSADAVGASWQSYGFQGGIWALPIDTAAQTGAWRPDLLAARGESVPGTLDEVLALAARLAPHGQHVGWPAVPTDQMCTLFSIAASLGFAPGRAARFLDPADTAEVVGWLKRLLAAAHPLSRGWNPIRCLDRMAAADDVAYVPYLFNYVTYSTGPSSRPVRFGAAPRVAPGLAARTLLGGAGIGVSARSANPQAAFDYAMHLCRPAFQAAEYVQNGGQPGSRTAWVSEACNALTNGFFAACLPVLDAAWLRPTDPGFVGFFHRATLGLNAVLTEDAPVAAFAADLNDSFAAMRDPSWRAPA